MRGAVGTVLAVLALAVTAVAGCVTVPAPALALKAAPAPDSGCAAGSLQGLVGQPREVLAGVTVIGPMRVVPPNGRVTMDFVPNRVNIALDAAGIITAVTCG